VGIKFKYFYAKEWMQGMTLILLSKSTDKTVLSILYYTNWQSHDKGQRSPADSLMDVESLVQEMAGFYCNLPYHQKKHCHYEAYCL
jgi:hypothetical protein